jgi:hypothetical protein
VHLENILTPKGPRGPKWVAAKTGHVITNCDLFRFIKKLECIILVKRASWEKINHSNWSYGEIVIGRNKNCNWIS